MKIRKKRRLYLAHRLRHFAPPRKKLPAITRQYFETCEAVTRVRGGRGGCVIWAPYPWKFRS